MPEYPTDRSPHRDPTPWDARWNLPRSEPYVPRRTPLLRGVVAILIAIGLVLLADLALDGVALGLVALVVFLGALAAVRF
jgi:hypothetical protein